LAPSSSIPEGSLSKKEEDAGIAPTDPAALSESGRSQAPSKGAKAATARSDEEAREGPPHRSPSPIRHREVLTRSAKKAAGAPGNSSHSQVPPKKLPPFPRLAGLYHDVTGQGWSSEILGAAAARRATSEEPPATGENGLKRKLRSKKGIEHLQRHSSHPSSDYASRQRTRNERSQGSGSPRPVAGGSRFGTRS
jgi:hypothetical protein